jgi:hypothetical protein
VKKLFVLSTAIVALSWVLASASFANAQVRFCPSSDWILTTDGLYCVNKKTGESRPSDTVPPSSPTPTPTPAPTPTPQPSSPGGSGALPECTDNYNTGQICLPKPPYQNCTGIACSGSVVQLAAKVVTILLYFAGIVAVIFVIIGGYKYMTAGGNEESATKGRKTMTQAIIGLVIVILAYVIITAVTNFLIK